MQFRLPQFLDIEDKVFGPFTLRQFAYMLGAGAFGYLFWKLIPIKILAIPFILVFSGTFLALAFVKIHNRPFADVLENAYKFFIGNKTYIWQKNKEQIPKAKTDLRAIDILKKKESTEEIMTSERIKELSSRLDIFDEKKKNELNLREELIRKTEAKRKEKRFGL